MLAASGEQPLQRVVDYLRIGLPARRAHHLADEEFEDALVSAAVLGDVVGILLDHLAAHALDLASVLNLRQALSLDDRAGRFSGLEHFGEDLFAAGAGDAARFHPVDQFGERGRRNGAGLDIAIGVVEAAQQLRLDPAGGGLGGCAGLDGALVIAGQGAGGGQPFSVIGRESIFGGEALAPRRGQFGHGSGNLIDLRFCHSDRQQIGIGEVAVVVGEFLGAHRLGAALGDVPQARFLIDAAAGFEHADLALDFIFQGVHQIAEGVQILHFGLGAELFRAAAAHADVGVAAQRALLHIAVADLGIQQHLLQCGEISVRLGRSAHVGFGNDFGERRAAAVVVHVARAGGIGKALVQIFGGIVFKMQPCDADLFQSSVYDHLEPAVDRERQLVHRDLIALGKIWVEIVVHLRAKREKGCTSRFSARDARIPSSRARLLSTGSAPGRPRHTWQVMALGGSTTRVEQPQKIFGRGLELDMAPRDRRPAHTRRGPRERWFVAVLVISSCFFCPYSYSSSLPDSSSLSAFHLVVPACPPASPEL